jgi:hypothetical protein
MGTKVIYQDSGQEVLFSKDGVVAITSRNLQRQVSLPEHPTINGFINDSIVVEPREIVVEGVVSNVNDYFGEERNTSESYRLDYESKLEAILTSNELLVIETHNRQYFNMRLESFTFDDEIDGFKFSCTFKEMNLGQTKEVKTTKVKKPVSLTNSKRQSTKSGDKNNPPPKQTVNEKDCNTGKNNTKKKGTFEQKKSTLKKLKDWYTGNR